MNPNVTWDAGQLSSPSLAIQSEDSSNAAMLLPKSAAPSVAIATYVSGERPANRNGIELHLRFRTMVISELLEEMRTKDGPYGGTDWRIGSHQGLLLLVAGERWA